jgi:hypothetical protein
MEAQSLLKKVIWYRGDRGPFFFGVFIYRYLFPRDKSGFFAEEL